MSSRLVPHRFAVRFAWPMCAGVVLCAAVLSRAQTQHAPGGSSSPTQPVSVWHFSKIIDSDTAVPGLGGHFAFDPAFPQRCPQVSATDVVFLGMVGEFDTPGIYRFSAGALSVITDWTTPTPHFESTQTLSYFSWCGTNGSDAAFSYSSAGGDGILRATSSGFALEASELTPVPNQPGYFFDGSMLAQPGLDYGGSMDATQIVFNFHPATLPWDGVYAIRDGTVSVIADRSTPVPGGRGNFSLFAGGGNSMPVTANGRVVFMAHAANNDLGLYEYDSGSLSTVVEQTTPLPGTPGDAHVDTIAAHAFDGATIVFQCTNGVWKSDGGRLTELLAPWHVIPGTTIYPEFYPSYVPGVSIDGGRVAVRVSSQGRSWILSDLKGELLPFVATSDVLDGKSVTWLAIGNHAIAAGRIAFAAGFSDGSWGFYLAE